MGNNVIQWTKKKTNQPDFQPVEEARETYTATEEISVLNKGPMPTDKLYPRMSKFDPAGDFSKEVFSEAIGLIDLAREAIEQGDVISSDCNIQALPVLLKQIFLIRSDSDGIRLLVSSVFNAIKNKNGIPLNIEEISALRLTLYRGRQFPFLTFEEALAYTEDYIESLGLNTDPENASYVEEWLGV